MRTLSVFLLVALAGPAAAQQEAKVPDLSGVWRRAFQIQNLLDPPLSGAGPVQQDPRYPKTDGNGVLRRPITEAERPHVIRPTVAWVPDVTSPILKPQTRAALQEVFDQELRGIPHPERQTQCMPSGVPHIVNILDSTQILQTPDEVIFLYSRDHQVRHVYLNKPHSANPGHTWYGESVGHYEGDTLVIDTIGLNDKTYVDRFNTPHSDQIHVVERYRRTAPDRIEATVWVDDPVAFTTPWSGRAVYTPAAGPFLEVVCAESQRLDQYWPGVGLTIATDDTPDF
jgi:hypothetical protein